MITKKFEQLDSLRFLAILCVMVSHWHFLNIKDIVLYYLGALGVNLFFVISGFLITLGLLRSKENNNDIKESILKFYVRRALRIFPIYYLTLLLLWFFNHPKVADGILWYLSYLTNFYCIKRLYWGGASHLWSLAVEEQFYLIWPFIILFSPKRVLLHVIVGFILISLLMKAYWTYEHFNYLFLYMHPLAAIDVLGLGALLAFLYTYHKELLNSILYNKLFIVLIVFQVAIFVLLNQFTQFEKIQWIFFRFSYGLLFFTMTGYIVFGVKGFIGKILSFKPFLYIGKISYAIYLFHIFIPGMLLGLKYPLPDTFLRFCLYFTITVIFAAISWKYFELPILRLKERFE